MHGVVFALFTPKPNVDSNARQLRQLVQANKVCRHTLLSALSNDLFDVYCSYKESKEIWDSLILKYTTEDVIKQRFIIANYYHWTIISRYLRLTFVLNSFIKLASFPKFMVLFV